MSRDGAAENVGQQLVPQQTPRNGTPRSIALADPLLDGCHPLVVPVDRRSRAGNHGSVVLEIVRYRAVSDVELRQRRIEFAPEVPRRVLVPMGCVQDGDSQLTHCLLVATR